MASNILTKQNVRFASRRWPEQMNKASLCTLRLLTDAYAFSILMSDLILLNGSWYVTHTGLLRLASRHLCVGIHSEPVREFSDANVSRWAFKATVYKEPTCYGFVGFGDADPSNVSPLVHGAEMRIAETRAVNRALRKAYGIGICSAEEIGSFGASAENPANVQLLPPKAIPTKSGIDGGTRVRDHLCRIIRRHELDPILVKAYAADFCGTKTLREASRAQVENFVAHLADWAQNDRNALLCQLNSYFGAKKGAA